METVNDWILNHPEIAAANNASVAKRENATHSLLTAPICGCEPLVQCGTPEAPSMVGVIKFCRLHTAAPAMLEALLLVNENNDGVLTLDAIQAVRAAIAQATGKD